MLQIMKILEFHWRNTKTMNLKILIENQANHENHISPFENSENYENR